MSRSMRTYIFRSDQALIIVSAEGQATGGRRPNNLTAPNNSVLHQPAGSLLKGATDDEGNLKSAALMLGIKLDLEAEIHLTARVRGDITVGLY